MRSTTLSPRKDRCEIRSVLEAVRISSNLIAFYPQPLRQPQPYVNLLDPATGILRHLNLQTAE